MKKVSLKKIFSEKELPKTFIRFYLVGLLLFIIPYTRNLFIHLISISLLFVIGCIFYHHKKWDKKTILLFSFIAISSFVLELAGVNRGNIFGEYTYDNGLGIKLMGTPLLIGLNWVFLVYASQAIISRRTNNIILRIAGGALLMIVYDLIVELVAPVMQMWHFDQFYPPFQNFLVWFLAAAFYHSLLVVFKINTDNRPAEALFGIQIVFFALISLFSLLI